LQPRQPDGGEHDDAVGAELDRVCDRRVVDDATVHEEPAVPNDRREHAGDRRAGEQRVHDRTVREQHLLAGQHVGGHGVHRNRSILQAREVAVALDHPPQAGGRERMVPDAKRAERRRQRAGRKHV
jgi:hypothetical protein